MPMPKPVRNAPSVLPTTLRFMATRLLHRLRGSGGASPVSEFRSRIDAVATQLGAGVVRCDWLTLKPEKGWTDTGVDLPPDAWFSLLADGMVHLSRAFDVGFAPKVGLWLRVGNGEVDKIVGGGSSFSTGAGGRLQFTTKPPGEFADRHGAFDPQQKRDAMSGAFEIAILQWRQPVEPALAACAAIEPGLCGPLLQRWRQPLRPPQGWHYLWRLGDGEIFHEHGEEGGQRSLRCHTASDVGILQFPIDQPLSADTRLSWSWCVDALPSSLPEHIQPTHDYLSIAIEFDNGLDLTWMWSAGLAEGTVFQCPLPWWDQRETHWVVRSGLGQIGSWVDEQRSVLADYRAAIGGPEPSRIVAVWLIANTAFQRGVGECRYRGIVVEGQGTRTVVFP